VETTYFVAIKIIQPIQLTYLTSVYSLLLDLQALRSLAMMYNCSRISGL
jgi:hypothetical protein